MNRRSLVSHVSTASAELNLPLAFKRQACRSHMAYVVLTEKSCTQEGEASTSSGIKCDVFHWRWAPSSPEEFEAARSAGVVSNEHAELSHFSLSGGISTIPSQHKFCCYLALHNSVSGNQSKLMMPAGVMVHL